MTIPLPNPTDIMDRVTVTPMNEVLLGEGNNDLTKLEENDALEQKVRKDKRHRKNQRILIFTTAAFFLFALAEFVGAIISGSLSLLGDAGAMSVDVFTVSTQFRYFASLIKQIFSTQSDSEPSISFYKQYLCNIFAEHLKSKNEKISERTRFIIEVLIPTFSLICLLGVTLYVAIDAVNVIMNKKEQDHDIDVVFLYAFAGANGVIDIMSSYSFFRKGDIKDVFYTTEDANVQGDRNSSSSSTDLPQPPSKVTNLNMMSAFTHLSGDTLRTSSVLVGALVSTFGGISSQICDAWAAIAVTITIIFIAIPLAYEIRKAWSRFN